MLDVFAGENIYALIDTVKTSIFWKDLDGKYLGCNQYVVDLAGLKNRADIIGKTDFELFGFNEATKARENDLIAIEKGSFEGKEMVVLPNGEIAFFWSVKHPLHDEQGKLVGITGSATNIAEHNLQKNLEKQHAIHNAELKISQIIDAVDASIYWKDLNGVILGCNQFVLNMFGAKDKQEIVGKNEYELISDEEAIRITQNDLLVISEGHYEGEETFSLPSGKTVTHYVVKNRLLDSDNNVVGLTGTSLDITAQKEEARLKLENEIQKVKLEAQEKLINLARKVAHDIGSPLSALNTMITVTAGDLHLDKHKIFASSAKRMLDISNSLLTTYRREENFVPDAKVVIEEEPQQPLFLYDTITQLISEKRVQYMGRPITLDAVIDDDAQFAFALMQPVQLQRTLSNLINNAADAMESGHDAVVTVRLAADSDHITISVNDNGKGMSAARTEKLLRRHFFTADKENGHGLGWQQVWDTIDQNQGKITIHSTIGVGTSVNMIFPRSATPDWIAQAIYIRSTDTVVILDDDESVHGAIALRFAPYLERHPTLRLHHFTHGQAAVDLLSSLTPEEKSHVSLLIDYDLFGQKKDGPDIIKASQIQRTTLITSYYTNADVQKRIQDMHVRVLPKQLVANVPVYIDEMRNGHEEIFNQR